MSHEQENLNNITTALFYGNNELYFNGTGSNISAYPDARPWESLITWELEWFFWAMYLIAVPPAIVLNFMVICIVLCVGKMRRNSTNYSILNLALADLLTSVCNTPWNFISTLYNDWKWGQTFCKIDQFLSNVCIAASVFTLLATSIERYWVLCYPINTTPSKTKMAIIMLGIWVVSVAISIPNLHYFLLHRDLFSSRLYCKWDQRHRDVELVYNVLFLIFTYCLPILSMAYCYFYICILLWNTRELGQRVDAQRTIQERKRTIKMLILVVLTFAICWFPFHVYFVVNGLWPSIKHNSYTQIIFIIFYWLAMLNSTLNPLIYYRFIPNFRRRFKQIFRCNFLSRLTRLRAIGINQLDRYDNSRTLAASRQNELGNGTTMDAFVSDSQKHSLDALNDETVDAQQSCKTDACIYKSGTEL